MNKLLVILGPTSTGKTDLAIKLAKKFEGEIVSADSRQIYKGLDIGTGKMPSINLKVKSQKSKVKKGKGFWEIDGVKVWMYDVTNPKRQYNVVRFSKKATKIIKDIHKRGKLPILVGGTGLYIKAITEGLPNLAVPIDKILRKKLEKFSLNDLQKRLKKISLEKWQNLNESDRQNPRRLIRAIELMTLQPSQTKQETIQNRQLDILKIGLNIPRNTLYQKIDKRVLTRLGEGMIDEAIKLHKAGLSLKRMWQLGLEYGVLAGFLSGKIKKENLVTVLQGKIHDYARRQLTWFKKERDVKWFDITKKGYMNKVENLITKWYDTPDATQN